MSRTKQGGSVLGFTITGIAMVLLLIAGAYIVRHYWAPAGEIAKVSGPSAAQSGDASTNSNQKQSSNSGNSANNSPQTTAPTQPPAVSAPPTPAPTAPDTPLPVRLPTTGPADTLLSAVILGVMAAAATAYVQSLRHRVTL